MSIIVGCVGIMLKMKININKLQKKYDDAVKNKIDVFMYDGNEILTSYAKYLLEYLKMEQNK